MAWRRWRRTVNVLVGQSPALSRASSQQKALHLVRAVVYVKASNALEGADRWVRDEHDDMDGPSRPMSEDVAEVAEVRA